VRWRVALVLLQALLPAAAASTFWIPLDGRQYLAKPACGLLLAATAAAWLGLAARAWRESVTLVPPVVIVRNVFRTRRIPLTDVTGVAFGRGGAGVLRLVAALPAAALPPVGAPAAGAPAAEIISPQRARRRLGAGMALLVPAGLLGTLGSGPGLAASATNLAGRMLLLGAAVMIGPAACAALDRCCARWRGRPGRALDRVP